MSAAASAASSAAPAATEEVTDQNEIIRRYQELRSMEQNLLSRIGDMQAQESEYRIVLDTIAPLEGARKCYQLIGGVLVERTIEDVLPIVRANHEGIVQLLKSMSDKLAETAETRQAHQTKYGIRTVSQAEAQRLMAEQQAAAGGTPAGGEAQRASTGVLA